MTRARIFDGRGPHIMLDRRLPRKQTIEVSIPQLGGAVNRDFASLVSPSRRIYLLRGAVSAGSFPHVFVQEGENIGLPNGHPEMEKVVPIICRFANRRIDLQEMRLTDLLATGVEYFS